MRSQEELEEGLLRQILMEYRRARSIHPRMASALKGYMRLQDEIDELWDVAKVRKPDRNLMAVKAVQIGAVALKFLIDICRSENRKSGLRPTL